MPFISTTHYSLLSALKHWGIKPGQVQIINLQPPAIIAAWQRGDIDGAYVWAPAVNELEKEGKVLTDSSQVGEWGAPTLDVWVVRKDFAEQHPEIVKAFAKSANILASALGRTVVNVISVNEDSVNVVPYRLMSFKAAARDNVETTTPVDPSDSKMESHVTIVFEIA